MTLKKDLKDLNDGLYSKTTIYYGRFYFKSLETVKKVSIDVSKRAGMYITYVYNSKLKSLASN